jgi:aryl-alcohol dehydrogenase-like predicted oxidoreductase
MWERYQATRTRPRDWGGELMERRRLGRIGHMSSVLIYGGAAIGDVRQDVADASIRQALDAGINHFDTAAAYGESEVRLGVWMPRIRDRIFIGTKAGDRTSTGAYDSIRRSLHRLQVEYVDLIQLHAIGDVDDLGRATGSGGALEGALRARDEGLVRAIGITGHGMDAPATHLEALRRFPFDTVLTPCNYRLWIEDAYRRDLEALEEEIRAQDAGLMFIKAVARNLWRPEPKHRYDTWYEPLDHQATIDAAVAFALSRPTVTGLATVGDVRLLPLMIDAERRRGEIAVDAAADELANLPEFESPFVRVSDREIPDWL